MLTNPIPATAHALRETGLTIGDIDLFEVSEAFAGVVRAWLDEAGADPDRGNVNGGAIALGHPIGASGTKLFATLLHELERRRAVRPADVVRTRRHRQRHDRRTAGDEGPVTTPPSRRDGVVTGRRGRPPRAATPGSHRA